MKLRVLIDLFVSFAVLASIQTAEAVASSLDKAAGTEADSQFAQGVKMLFRPPKTNAVPAEQKNSGVHADSHFVGTHRTSMKPELGEKFKMEGNGINR